MKAVHSALIALGAEPSCHQPVLAGSFRTPRALRKPIETSAHADSLVREYTRAPSVSAEVLDKPAGRTRQPQLLTVQERCWCLFSNLHALHLISIYYYTQQRKYVGMKDNGYTNKYRSDTKPDL